jgi:hypothetical protein
MHNNVPKARKQIIFGLLLVGMGALFLMDRSDLVDVGNFWHYWPAILVAFGINDMIPPTTGKRMLDGFYQILIGAWLYVSIEHVWGITFSTSWPFVVIIAGLGMVVKPLLVKNTDANKEI